MLTFHTMVDSVEQIIASVSIFYMPYRNKLPNTLSQPMTESVSKILKQGFGVELWTKERDCIPFTEDSVQNLIAICKTRQTVTAHTTTYRWQPKQLRKEIKFTSLIGAKILVVHPETIGFEKNDQPHDFGLIRDICNFARDSGIHLALENTDSGITNLKRTIDVIGDDPDKTGLGICVDTGHANRTFKKDGVKPANFLKEFRGTILELHLHDNEGYDDLHLPPGEGAIDWDKIFSAMRSLPNKTIINLELTSPDIPMETIHKSKKFVLDGLKKVIDKSEKN